MTILDVKLFEEKREYPKYSPTKSEETKIGFIMSRFESMKTARTAVDRYWDKYQEMIEAEFEPYPDERSSSVVPLASSLIELFVADALKLQTEFKFKWETSEYSTQAKALEYVWKYDFRKNNRKKEFVKNEYITAWFWTSVIYTWYESYKVTQKDIVIQDDMTIDEEKVTLTEKKIIVKNIDIRDFYIDDQVENDFDEASDCILRQWISYEKFNECTNSPIYKNTDKVAPKQYSKEDRPFSTREEDVKQWAYVELMHYWNVDKDAYMVLANGVLIREHPVMSTIDGRKALPFAVRWLWYKTYSIYYRGICEALLMFNSEINNLRELLMDGIRRSNSQVLAIGNWLTFDWREFSYDNEILTFDGNLSGNFEQISGNAPNQAIFNYIVQLYKDIAIYVGLDIQNVIWEPQQTAFQTEVQREASQKRVNVWLTNRDLAFERFANLYKDLLQKYFPRKTAEGLYPRIEVDWEKLVWEWEKSKFIKSKGKHIFEVTEEILRWDMYVDVYTNTTAPTINAVDKAQKLDLLNTIGQISQWYALAKQAGVDLETILPIKTTLSELASDYNLNVQTGGGDGVKEALRELQQDLQNMAQPELLPNQEEQWAIQ